MEYQSKSLNHIELKPSQLMNILYLWNLSDVQRDSERVK